MGTMVVKINPKNNFMGLSSFLIAKSILSLVAMYVGKGDTTSQIENAKIVLKVLPQKKEGIFEIVQQYGDPESEHFWLLKKDVVIKGTLEHEYYILYYTHVRDWYYSGVEKFKQCIPPVFEHIFKFISE